MLQIYTDSLTSFGVFSKCFCKNSFTGLPTYKEAIFQIIEVRDLKKKKSQNMLQKLFQWFSVRSVFGKMHYGYLLLKYQGITLSH